MTSLRSFFITFLIALLVFGVCAFFITGFVTDSINSLLSGEQVTDPVESTTIDPDGPVGPIDPDTEIKGDSFNVLLIGTDYRPSVLHDYHPQIAEHYPAFSDPASLIGYEGALPMYNYRRVKADAVMLICVNKEKHSFTYMQIPTNMQLTVAGVSTTVADLYYDMGLAYFVDKMSGITGVPIDYYALTGIEEISGVVDAMDSITYTVPCDMEYTDEVSGLTISLKGGAQTLTGTDVAGLLSFNAYTNANLSREKTMLSFLKALAQKMTNVVYFGKAAEIFANAEQYVYTNFTSEDLLKNLDLIFRYSEFSVNTVEYPGSYYYSNGVRYFTPNITLAINNMAEYK
ncbi:MAG: LCP family protein [Clostridia bacterium]|nr:LCP family protein [Clostridia bacterium]